MLTFAPDKKPVQRVVRSLGQQGINLEDNRRQPVLRKANPKAAGEQRGVVQRNIDTEYHDGGVLSQKEIDKLTAVKQYMDTSLQNVNSTITKLYIRVIHMPGKNPASTRLNNPKTGIIVTVGSWFIKISSIGDICGMIAHEIGVHTLAKNQMPKHQRDMEKHFQKQPFTVKVGLHKHTVSPWDDDRSIRQRDHINVVRDKGDKGGPPVRGVQSIPQYTTVKSKKGSKRGFKKTTVQLPSKLVNSVNARMQQYAATVLRLGDAIDGDGHISPKERDNRLHDLLNSFLFDYARILVTDDTQWHVIDKTPLVAQTYNWYKNVIIARHGNNHQWLRRKSMQPTSSTWGLRAYLAAKLGHAIAIQIAESQKVEKLMDKGGTLVGKIGSGISSVVPGRVQQTVKGIGGFVGGIGSGLWSGTKGLVGWGMNQVSSHTPELVKKGVSGVGTVVGTTLRGLDYLYGETENLIVPPLVKGTSKVIPPLVKGAKKVGHGIKTVIEMMDPG